MNRDTYWVKMYISHVAIIHQEAKKMESDVNDSLVNVKTHLPQRDMEDAS